MAESPTPPAAVALPRVAARLSPAQLCRALLAGRQLVASRIVPGPHTYRLLDAEGRYGVDDKVREAQVAALVRAGHDVPRAADALWDRIDYALTPRGRALALTLGPVTEEGAHA